MSAQGVPFQMATGSLFILPLPTCCRLSPARSTASVSTTATTRSAPRTPTQAARTSTAPSAASTPRPAGPSTSTRAPRAGSAAGPSNTSATTAASPCPRVERREARAARRSLERGCRRAGMPRELARSITARLHPRPAARRPPRRPSSPAGSTPDQRAWGTQLLEWQRGDMRHQRTAEDERVQPRGPRRTPPAAPPLSRRAVRRSASCAATAPERASSCDARHRTERASPRTRRGPRAHRLAPRPDRRRHHRHVRLQRRGAVRRKAQRACAAAGRPHTETRSLTWQPTHG